jgi:hypothetical protein
VGFGLIMVKKVVEKEDAKVAKEMVADSIERRSP